MERRAALLWTLLALGLAMAAAAETAEREPDWVLLATTTSVRDSGLLDELRREGLFEREWVEPDEAEELRVATCLMRELGVNPAGVEVVLHMRRRRRTLEHLTSHSLRRLLAELDRVCGCLCGLGVADSLGVQ